MNKGRREDDILGQHPHHDHGVFDNVGVVEEGLLNSS